MSGPGEAHRKDDDRHPRGPGAQAKPALQAGVKQRARRGSESHQAENNLVSTPTRGTVLGQGDCAHGGRVAAAAHLGELGLRVREQAICRGSLSAWRVGSKPVASICVEPTQVR